MKLFNYLCISLSFAALTLGVGATACNNTGSSVDRRSDSVHNEVNSIYYWKTTLALDSAEREFLHRHNVERAYVRFFDVVTDKSATAIEPIVPNATVRFNGTLPVKSIIPVVYITLDAMRSMKGNEQQWAEKISNRVINMCAYNDLGKLWELQLDCDWTEDTRDSFFELCRNVKKHIRDNNKGIGKVSSTIRLHQLSQPVPPVDYGVLMVYNTGSFKNPDTANSILDSEDVEPYLKNLKSYPLHLDIAYPAYEWQLLFRDNTFVGLIRSELPDSIGMLSHIGGNRYELTRDTIVGETYLRQGDMIRRESAPVDVVLKVKQLIDNRLGDRPHSNVIYHLDNRNLSKYTSDEINSIYTQ